MPSDIVSANWDSFVGITCLTLVLFNLALLLFSYRSNSTFGLTTAGHGDQIRKTCEAFLFCGIFV